MPGLRAPRSARPILTILLAFALGVGAGGLLPFSQAENDPLFQPFWEAWALIQSRYIDEVDAEQLVAGALTGLVDSLGDEFSYYIAPEVYARDYTYSGEFTGIGVMVKTNSQGGIVVMEVAPDSPAAAAGVLVGDIFYAVDGEAVAGLTQDELSALVPGARGTNVRVTFRRGAALHTFDIVRDVFVVPNVAYELHGDIAYIAMHAFHKLSRSQLEAALAALDMASRAGLVFDLRGNPGGTIESAIDVASLFIEDEIVLQQVDRDGQTSQTRGAGGSASIHAPIALLVDSESASASELLAGALQDHARATIIGEATFGKGTVQAIQEVANGGAVRLTVRRYLTPLGRNIDQTGVVPDIIIEADDDSEVDEQLTAAIAFLESLRS
ncbi:MAG: S41 family peptidase [Chloroflexi bacterium]|nr:S41 family peptidase [Chloroflexota bacterium]MCY4248332.1 S41 family peptidase [Chloroflexota bacterium]